jgi:hypothetical protein
MFDCPALWSGALNLVAGVCGDRGAEGLRNDMGKLPTKVTGNEIC